jgi:hypothetical protein
MQIKAINHLRILEIPVDYFRSIDGVSKVSSNLRATMLASHRIVESCTTSASPASNKPLAAPLHPSTLPRRHTP